MPNERLILVALGFLLNLTITSNAAWTPPQIGIFPRFNDSDAKLVVDQYEAWLGRPVSHLVQFLPDNMVLSSTDIGALNWWVSQWAPYDQNYRDRMVISIAMLPNTATDSTATLAKGAAGDYNAWWQAAATKLVASGYNNAVIRPGWEFNGNWYRWSAAGKSNDFKNYWIQVYNTMNAVPGANFRFNWNPNVGNFGMNPMDAFPGVEYVDMIGLDFYDISVKYKNNPNYPHNMTQAQLDALRNEVWNDHRTGLYDLDWWASKANELGLPLTFPEWGLDKPLDSTVVGQGGQDNTFLLQKFHDWINEPANNVVWASYFEWGTGASSRNHSIFLSNQFPGAKALYPQLFGPVPEPSTLLPLSLIVLAMCRFRPPAGVETES